jgi:hypothetical protein
MCEDGTVAFGKPQKVKMVFQVTKAGEVAGVTFKKAASLGSQYKTELKTASSDGGVYTRRVISGPKGKFSATSIRNLRQDFPLRSYTGKKDGGVRTVKAKSAKTGRKVGRMLYRVMGFSKKSLVKAKAKKHESSTPTSYDSISSSGGYSH